MCQLSLSLFLSRPCRFKFCRLKIFQFLKRHFNRSGCFTGEDAVKVVLTHPIPREGWLVLVLPPAHVVEPGPPNHVVLFYIFAHAFVLESNPSFDWLNILLLHVTYYSSPPPSSSSLIHLNVPRLPILPCSGSSRWAMLKMKKMH